VRTQTFSQQRVSDSHTPRVRVRNCQTTGICRYSVSNITTNNVSKIVCFLVQQSEAGTRYPGKIQTENRRVSARIAYVSAPQKEINVHGRLQPRPFAADEKACGYVRVHTSLQYLLYRFTGVEAVGFIDLPYKSLAHHTSSWRR